MRRTALRKATTCPRHRGSSVGYAASSNDATCRATVSGSSPPDESPLEGRQGVRGVSLTSGCMIKAPPTYQCQAPHRTELRRPSGRVAFSHQSGLWVAALFGWHPEGSLYLDPTLSWPP